MKHTFNHQSFYLQQKRDLVRDKEGKWEFEEDRALRKIRPVKKKSQRRKKSFAMDGDEFMIPYENDVPLAGIQGRWMEENPRPARGHIK